MKKKKILYCGLNCAVRYEEPCLMGGQFNLHVHYVFTRIVFTYPI